MPNANYNAGRQFEYDRMRFWKREMKCIVWRSAGSHGPSDVTAVSPTSGTVTFIQCKRVETLAAANRLLNAFKENPPLGHFLPPGVHQSMEVKVKGSKDVMSVTV